MKWISVDDRLPERDTDVLVFGEHMNTQVGFLFSSNELWFLTLMDMDEIVDVTHWMPLPEPPETGSGND